MCRAFSCLILKDGEVVWRAGLDSHENLIDLLSDDQKKKEDYVRAEVVPPQDICYPYLHPELDWTLSIDETEPEWFSVTHRQNGIKAFEEWKHQIYDNFNYKEALNPVNPSLVRLHKVSKNDISNLKRCMKVSDSVWSSVWDSVRDSVWSSVWDSIGDSVWSSVWDSIGDSVWDSVWSSVWDSVWSSVWDSIGGYIGSLFPNIKTWKYTGELEYGKGKYPFQCYADLWRRGFILSFDGKKWRLHAGKDAHIVCELDRL